MATLIRVEDDSAAVSLLEQEQAIEDEYRAALAGPAVLPWVAEFAPVTIGNTWKVGSDGRFLLPEWSLGWEWLRWSCTRLRMNGEPFRPTLEQLRLALWMMEIDPGTGQRTHVTCVVQRLKGWGKDPFLAAISLFQFDGPSKPWDIDESDVPADRADARRVIGILDEQAWVQLAAVSSEQTKNTVLLLPSMYPRELARERQIMIGAEKTRAVGTSRLLEAVTSNPATMEGGRPTFTGMNEPHLWVDQNRGTAMSEVIDRNATKVANSWVLAITNAFEPGQDSAAEKLRDQFELIRAGDAFDTGLYYDSLEAPSSASMAVEDVPRWIEAVRGDSSWLDVRRITAACLDTRIPPSRARRFYYNAIETAEDRWLDTVIVNALAAKPSERLLEPGDAVFVFFDGSKSDDNTGLVCCRLEDGAVFQLGIWKRPPGLHRTKVWTVPRQEVNQRVAEVMQTYRVLGLWGDPSDARDDEEERYWQPILDEWHRLYGKKLKLWAAAESGANAHSTSWDMRTPSHVSTFVRATMLFAEEAEARRFYIGKEEALKRHLKNARKRLSKYGTGIGKASQSSDHKIDLAVCAVGARMMRREWLNRKVGQKKTSGRVVTGVRRTGRSD